LLFFNCNFCSKRRNTLVDQQISHTHSYSTDAIADYINAHFQTEDNKIRAVFYWTASNISYDVDKMVALNNKEALENNSKKY
jgi:tagatose-1,6-bisphosphate aldolase non-catalytic subunit AgaZ/GatZ